MASQRNDKVIVIIFLLVFAIDFYLLELKLHVVKAYAFYLFLRYKLTRIQSKRKTRKQRPIFRCIQI